MATKQISKKQLARLIKNRENSGSAQVYRDQLNSDKEFKWQQIKH